MHLNQNKMPIVDALKKFDSMSPLYLCMPAHHRGNGADKDFINTFGSQLLKYDLTETPLTDDLHDASGCIMEAEQLASDLFGSDRTFFLVNGTTCGNEAMIISSVHEGDKILVARNCHKSILMGLIISGAEPVFIEPEISFNYNTLGSISPQKVKKAFEDDPSIRAFILVSPTYYGICSDLKSISEICHSYNALLLVDEAHGAHLSFSEKLPVSAMTSNADMAAQSTHKTAGSMTQSSMLHTKGRLIDEENISSALKIVQSTSPSYILMASLDSARHNLAINGIKFIENSINLAEYIRYNLNKIIGVTCYDYKNDSSVFSSDITRIVFNISGIRGFRVYDLLFKDYKICAEMADEHNVVLIIGYSDTISQADILISAIANISKSKKTDITKFSFTSMPKKAISPRTAYFSHKEACPFNKSVGMICGEMIAVYPPGIPIIYPGEIITEEIKDFLIDAISKKLHIHGLSDKNLDTIKIIRP